MQPRWCIRGSLAAFAVIPPLILILPLATALAAEPLPLQERAGRTLQDIHVLPKSTLQEARSINHVEGAHIRLDAAPAAKFDFTAEVRGAEALLDGNAATHFRLDAFGARSLDIVFNGAAEWVNQVELVVRGTAAYTVDMLDTKGQWSESKLRLQALAKPIGDEPLIFEVPVGRYQGIRLRLTDDATGDLELLEVGAYWFEPEALKDAFETADEWAEDYPGTGNDLSSPNDTAQRFSSYLAAGGYAWIFDWGNQDCWESDYKRHDLGGQNNAWIDATDIFMHCSHGSDNMLWLARTDQQDTDVTASDISGAWGDGDLEWLFTHCCLNMKNLSWHNSLNGAHTVSGWRNVINSSANYGQTIAGKLWDSGAFDSAWTIWQSWWHANDSHQPAGNKGTLVAEDYGHYNEYIWSQGPVLDDSPDGSHWYTDHTVSKMSKMGDVLYGTGPVRSSEPVLWEPRPGLGKAGQPAMRVYVHPEVLAEMAQKGQQEVGIYRVLPADLTPGEAQTALGRICELLGDACPTLASGREDEMAVAAGAGGLSLSGAIHSGALLFTDTEKLMVPERGPGQMIDPQEAASMAANFLGALGLLTQQHSLASIQTMTAVEFMEGATGGIQVLQEFPFMHDVVFGKSIASAGAPMIPVLGHGGRLHVSIGPAGELLGFNAVDRQLEQVAQVTAIPLSEALDNLAAFGYGAVESAPEFPATSIVVRGADLAYFERGAFDVQPVVGPVYYLDVDLTDERGKRVTEPGRIYMTADMPSLMGTILEPSDGVSVPLGDPIDFAGQISGGTAPYSVQWISSVEGLVSTQLSFTTDQLQPTSKAGGTAPITMELQVTDANGYSASALISINFTGVTPSEELPTRFALEQNFPNPFNPRTVIAFQMPEAGEVSLAVYDQRGRLVHTLLDGVRLQAGPQSRMWEGTDTSGRPVAAGVYHYRLIVKSGGRVLFEQEKKMTLIK